MEGSRFLMVFFLCRAGVLDFEVNNEVVLASKFWVFFCEIVHNFLKLKRFWGGSLKQLLHVSFPLFCQLKLFVHFFQNLILVENLNLLLNQVISQILHQGLAEVLWFFGVINLKIKLIRSILNITDLHLANILLGFWPFYTQRFTRERLFSFLLN